MELIVLLEFLLRLLDLVTEYLRHLRRERELGVYTKETSQLPKPKENTKET